MGAPTIAALLGVAIALHAGNTHAQSCTGVCNDNVGEATCAVYVGTSVCHTYDENVPPFHERGSDSHVYYQAGVTLGPYICSYGGHGVCGGLREETLAELTKSVHSGNWVEVSVILKRHRNVSTEFDATRREIVLWANCPWETGRTVIASVPVSGISLAMLAARLRG